MTAARLVTNPPEGSGLTHGLLDALYEARSRGRTTEPIPVTGVLRAVGHGSHATKKGEKRHVVLEFYRLEPAVNGDADTVTHLVSAAYEARTTPDQTTLPISDADAAKSLLLDIDAWAAEEGLDFEAVNDKFQSHFGPGFAAESYRLVGATQLREFALTLGVIPDETDAEKAAEDATDQGDEEPDETYTGPAFSDTPEPAGEAT